MSGGNTLRNGFSQLQMNFYANWEKILKQDKSSI